MENNQQQISLIRLPEVRKIVPLSRPTIYRRIQEGKFPAPIKDGRCSLWDEAEVRAYVARLFGQRPPGENQANPPKPA